MELSDLGLIGFEVEEFWGLWCTAEGVRELVTYVERDRWVSRNTTLCRMHGVTLHMGLYPQIPVILHGFVSPEGAELGGDAGRLFWGGQSRSGALMGEG